MQVEFDHGAGITAIDSGYGRPRHVAVHLIVEAGRAAIIDTAHNASVPRVMSALRARDIGPEQVDWVILTHVHLDHAGAAGALMSLLPNARLAVHPRGARHMIDPRALMAGTIAVYGEQAARDMYGEIIPVAAQRVVETPEGTVLSLAGRSLNFLDTPGHARHHVCIHDERTGHVFTGDTFGISYRELDRDGLAMIFPTTSPVQFDPQQMHRSVERIAALRPDAVYLTHFSRVGDVPRLADDLHRLIDAHAAIGRECADAGEQRNAVLSDAIRALLLQECVRHGIVGDGEPLPEVLEHDVTLNAAGLEAWIDSWR